MSNVLKPLQLRLFLLLIASFTIAISRSQTTYSWVGANNASWAVASNWSPVRTIPATTDILQFNDGTSKTVTAVPSQTIGKLIVSNNTSIVLNPASTGRTITINNSTGTDFTVAAGSTAAMGTSFGTFTLALAGNVSADISGTFTIGNGQTYTTNAASSSTAVSATGTIQNSGTINSSAGTLSFASGASYIHALNGGAIPAATWNANANTTITGITGTVPAGLGQSFGNFTWNCAGQTADIDFNGNFTTVNGDLTFTNTNSRHIFMGSSNTVTINIAGDATIGSAGNTAIWDMDNSNGSISINLRGNLITLGNGQIDNQGSLNATFTFNKSSGTQTINFGNATSFGPDWGGNFYFGTGSTSNEVVLQTNMAMGTTYSTNVNVRNGTTLDMGVFIISNKGTFTTSAGSTLGIGHAAGLSPTSTATGNVQVSSTKSYSSSTNFLYKGTVAQVTGTGLPTTIGRLIIDNTSGVNTSGGVTLSQGTTINTELVLTNSYLKTSSANMLTLAAGSISTPSNNAFVAGPMRKTGNTNFTFPTGWAGVTGGRIPITISSLSASRTVQAEYKRASGITVGSTVTAPLQHISNCEYWELFPTTSTLNVTVTMNWNAYSNCSVASYVNNLTTLRIARSNGTAWTNAGNTATTGTIAAGTITSNAATTIDNSTPFKYFTLASTTASTNPLPVLLTDVKAYPKNNGVQVEWTNQTEKNIYHYIVEHSADGRDFSELRVQLPSGNRGDEASYTAFDANPAAGINYYRIKATELDGNAIYSKILRVDMGDSKAGLVIYPNPVVNHQLAVAMTGIKAGDYRINIINTSGQLMLQKNLAVRSGAITESVSLPASARPGVYTLLITGENYSERRIFVVQ